jgi:glycosyltransferase involved in cell wall biosynthesis
MRIVQLTVGTGNRYLGSTVRDQSLCSALRRMGHQVHFIRLWDDMLMEDEEYWRYDVSFNCKLALTAHTSWLYRSFGNLLPRKLIKKLGKRCYSSFYRLPRGERMQTIFDLDEEWGDVFRNEMDDLVKTVRNCRPHLILITGFPPRKVIENLRKKVDAPLILTLNGAFFDLLDTGVDKAHLKSAIEIADGVVSPSQYLMDEVTAAVNPDLPKQRIIQPGLMLNFYSARELLPPEPAIGYLGGLGDRNEFDSLMDAIYALRERGNVFKFIVLSGANSTERGEMDKRMAAFNDDKCVYRCLQYLPIQEKTQTLEQLTALALPGSRKAFGNPVVEAMAAGLPIVLPNAGPYPEIIRNGETGMLFDPKNPNELVDALEKVLTDRSLNKKLGHDARGEAVNRFSSERMTGDLLEFAKEFTSG